MYQYFSPLLIMIFSISAYGSPTMEELRDKVHLRFKNDPLVMQAVNKYLESQIELNAALNDKVKFVKAAKQSMRDAYCVHFVAAGDKEIMKKYADTVNDFGYIEEFKDFDAKDIAMRMDRSVREEIGFEFKNIKLNEKHKFCSLQLSVKEIEDLKLKIIESEAKNENAYVKASFDEFHEALRPMLLHQQKSIKEGNPKLSDSKVDDMVYENFMKIMMGILDSKAQYEVLPKIEKACPGIIAKKWMQCSQRDFYKSLAASLAPSMMRHLCLIDFSSEIVPRCIDENYFRITNIPSDRK